MLATSTPLPMAGSSRSRAFGHCSSTHREMDRHWTSIGGWLHRLQGTRNLKFLSLGATQFSSMLSAKTLNSVSLADEHAESVLADASRLLSHGRA